MLDFTEAIEYIKSNKVVMMPTDTVYGIVGSALDETVVDRIYELKKRNTSKPFIIEIATIAEISIFVNDFAKYDMGKLQEIYQSSPTTIIFENPKAQYEYISRGQKSLAIRVPLHNEYFSKVLQETGPIISTSANISGQPTFVNIQEAIEYWADSVDYYLDGGEIDANPSRIMKVDYDGNITEFIRK